MNYQPEIAIIEANTLTSLGLKGILEEMIPMATIRTFHHFSELMDDTPDMYAHYFISAQIYVEHNAFFLPPETKNDCIGKRQSAIPTVRRTCTQHSRIRRRAGKKYIETSPTCSPRRLSGKRYAAHASDAASSGNSIRP